MALTPRLLFCRRVLCPPLASNTISERLLSSQFSHDPFKRDSRDDAKSRFRAKAAQKVKSYALTKYVNYLKNYDQVLEAKFPRAMRVYRVFSVGVKDFYRDSKEFVRVSGLVRAAKKSGEGIHSVVYRDLCLYYRMPRDMLQVAPVLLISALPFANYVVFPLAFMFPKQLLCMHFWSLQQRVDFALQDHKKNVSYYRPVFRAMQARADSIEDEDLKSKWMIILSKLASGVHPSVDEVLSVQSLFEDEPYHLNRLYPRHKNQLLRLHGMHVLWSRRNRLAERALQLWNLDRALSREGVASLSSEDLRMACFQRGLNPSSMRTEDMIDWLSQWLEISTRLETSALSLLLHCPVLIGFNQPTNRVLMS